MVPEIQRTCQSSSPTPGNFLHCLICLKTIHRNNSKYVPKVSEILSDLFEVLCKYMDWSPPLRYQFNFNNEVFPFCKECKLTLVTLYNSHQLLVDIQKLINSVISKLCGKILLSQNDENPLKMKNKFTDSSQRNRQCEEIQRERDEKVTYFRKLVEKRYSASVRVIAYTQPLLVPSLTEAIDDERDDSGASEEWVSIEDEKVDFESLGILESNDVEALEEPILVVSPKIAIDQRHLEKSIEAIEEAEFDLEAAESNTAVTIEESLPNQEAKEHKNTEESGKVKRIVKSSEVSEMVILNHHRIPERNPMVKYDKRKTRTQILSDDDEDSDYEPSIASQHSDSADDYDNIEEIVKPSVDAVKVRAHFEPGRGKFFDRVRNVGNQKYLFDEKYGFELNAENKWVCYSCKNPYTAKAKLLNHLVKICKGASPKRNKNKRRKGKESSDSTDDIEEDSESSNFENIPDTKETEELMKTEDCLDEIHSDQVLKSNDRLEAKHNDSQTVSLSSAALELEKETNKVISGNDRNVTDEVQIRVVCNLFQKRPEFKNRIQKTGPSEYLLDDKISFEFVNNKWRCIPCELEYTQKYGLMRHFYSCPGNQPIDSVETFRLNQRIYDQLKGGKFQCRHCKQIYSSNNEVVVHLPRCHEWRRREPGWVELEPNKFLCNNKYPFEFKNDKFKCGSCSAVFIKKKKILSHIRSKHIPTSGTKWMSVKNTTPDKFIVNNKFSFEKVGDEYKCCECIYSSTAMKQMRHHMREKHINFGKFSCGTCGRKYGSQSSLTTHEKWHRTDRIFVCEICGNSFKTANSLSSHKDNIHPENSERNFLCPICGKAFRTQGLLNIHSKIHERTECDICGKRIAKTAFKNHVASHRNSKNHECKKCGKRYQNYSSLYVHLKSHDGVKPYSCDICDMKFTQHNNVTRHKNVVHNPDKLTKTYGKSRKRTREEVSSEEEKTDEEEEEFTDGESSSSDDASEEDV